MMVLKVKITKIEAKKGFKIEFLKNFNISKKVIKSYVLS